MGIPYPSDASVYQCGQCSPYAMLCVNIIPVCSLAFPMSLFCPVYLLIIQKLGSPMLDMVYIVAYIIINITF